MVSFKEKSTVRTSMVGNLIRSVCFADVYCLSSDEKPTEGVANGSSLLVMDTSQLFFFDEENGRWLEFGGGGG